ncbi:type VI secretion system-associated FHA domain protein TagH [Sphingomonas sp. 2R-10]|uniref:type VI secretion system-associated FHA domain protein TagH n=1 Tax=Sphingomonas sp. 2R-10 TaxID=3045148 RepID=UPI000F78C47E|nr:type VI secretion system-associated FHA domain protein TagH [Sphingomonas sp. 2R-10]MDJ0276623.1 type VI secretion system-associated FHA domain protein TagH [Sphingomonas sp. 2R-10]
MTLRLSIVGGPAGGTSGSLEVDRRTATIGRADGCDWVLPDPTRHLSSRHFEIRFDGSDYRLTDRSTNGTFLADTGQRVTPDHVVCDGDRFTAGPFTIVANVEAAGGGTTNWRGWNTEPTAAPATDDGWNPAAASGAAASGSASSGWGPPPSAGRSGSSGWQPQTGPSLARPEAHRAAAGWDRAASADVRQDNASGWAAPATAAAPVVSTWDSATPPPDPASAWSSAAPDRPAAPSPDDLWGRIAEGNVVDWARGGFGQPVEPPRDPLGLSPPAPAPAPPQVAPAPPSRTTTCAPAPAPSDAFVQALGIDPDRLDDDAAERGALLFRRLVAGLVVMLEARARAKAQLGAEATAFSPDGHNPLKFARTPDDALAMLLGAPQPGFMPPDRAVEDAFQDLQSHQMATLRAMQGALRNTLERFAPSAIRARAKAGGVLERVLPSARDAALWQAYEREFGGVAQGSDEAFLDMFAKEFREAYNGQARSPR